MIQAVFFAGAAWFRKTHYVKTLLAIAVLLTLVVALYIAIAWVLGWVTWSRTGILIVGDFENGIYRPLGWLFAVAKVGYFAVLPLFCWLVAWLRVRETQVSHGV